MPPLYPELIGKQSCRFVSRPHFVSAVANMRGACYTLFGLKGLFNRVSNIPDRLYKISKSYLDQVRDRIDAELSERERSVAEQELRGRGEDTSLPSFASNGSGPNEFRTADDMMRRAEERIAAARAEREGRDTLSPVSTAAASAPPKNSPASAPPPASDDPNASDFRVLGVPVGSDLITVLSAYEKLSRRCDPRRFPDGSAEQNEAARILVRVNASFENLRKRLDPTENRFGKLEL